MMPSPVPVLIYWLTGQKYLALRLYIALVIGVILILTWIVIRRKNHAGRWQP